MSATQSNSFSKADIESAHLAFSMWQGTQQETVDEYVMRKRKIELNCLVNEVIENELTQDEQTIVQLYWYESKTLCEIGAIMGVSHTSISRKLSKINDIIYDKLKYAIQYRYGKDYSRAVKVIIKNKDGLYLFHGKADSPALRIKNLRLGQGLTLTDTAEMTGISASKLEGIEKGEREILISDVMRIATAFRISCDYIILGKM